MKSSSVLAITLALFSVSGLSCNAQREKHFKVVVTSPQLKSVTLTREYFCQIQSQRHIAVRAFNKGYLESVPIKEGQHVKEGDLMFKVITSLHQAKLDVEIAEAQVAEGELKSTQKKFEDTIVSKDEVARFEAKLKKAQAEVKQAEAELNFATIKAPFDGFVGRLSHRSGSMVNAGDVLTTLSDDSVVRVYFNVSETGYLEYMADVKQHPDDRQVELALANGNKFQQLGTINAINADFNAKTGSIQFRADFPNPERQLYHGQSGHVLIHRIMDDAIVIPRRATFQSLEKVYVFVVDKQNVAHQREILVQNELDDLYVLKKPDETTGVGLDEKIVLEGTGHVRDGEKVECEEDRPEHVVAK